MLGNLFFINSFKKFYLQFSLIIPLSWIRCVNEYNIYVWKNGQRKEQGQILLNARGLGKIDASGLDSVKISNITNCATSFELTIDACVDMKFVVEFIGKIQIQALKNQTIMLYYLWHYIFFREIRITKTVATSILDRVISRYPDCIIYFFPIERDWTHTDKKMSQEVRYKTEAIPEFVDKNVTNFHLSYAFNPIIGSQVLDKASIKFPKRILKHANCIKHIEISGKKDNSGAFRQQFTR